MTASLKSLSSNASCLVLFGWALMIVLAMPTETRAASAVKRTLCVWDPGGAAGDIFESAKDFRIVALKHGVDFALKAYTDERTASEDFKAGQCHAALLTGTRVRQFHKFSGSFEAIGALPSYNLLKKLVAAVSKPKGAKLMRSGEYEVAGVMPGGAVYLLVNDRSLDTVEELAGKRIATLAYDAASKFMVRNIGSSMVAADVSTFAGMFNNGSVDACYAPATAYKVLELYKGLGAKGGILRNPLAQLTHQLVIRSKNFPEEFGQKAREFYAGYFDKALRVVKAAERGVEKRHWVNIPRKDQIKYAEQFGDVRVKLRDKDLYDATALKLMLKLRCRGNAGQAECAQKRE